MSDTSPNGAEAVQPPQASHPPFPIVRLLYAIGFAILAWFVIWILFAIGVVQFVVLAINGKVNDELKAFSVNLVQYLWELVAFIIFARDEQPFPIGPFPRHA